MSTTTSNETIQSALDKGNPNTLGDLVAKVKLGSMLQVRRSAVTQTAAATATLDPPALGPQHVYVNVTAGAAAAGVRTIADTSETPSATLATLSDDGATLTFEANVTDFVLDYMARADEDMTNDFPTTGLG